MAKGIDLTSQKWLDLVFEGKNKSYGAYVLREDSSNRHLKSIILVLVVGALFLFLPGLIKGLIPEKTGDEGEDFVVAVQDMNLTDIEKDVPEENIIKSIAEVPPPPALKQTIAFTQVLIAHDEEVREEDLMATQQELTASTGAISVATVEGLVGDGVDIADLEDHKVIVQAAVVEPYIFVEYMPEFKNGGEKGMYAWLQKNIVYPPVAQEQGIQGTVHVRFVVNADGTVGNVEIVRPLNPSLDKEAVRVINKMPAWTPGKQNGVNVPVYYTIPVAFKLEDTR